MVVNLSRGSGNIRNQPSIFLMVYYDITKSPPCIYSLVIHNYSGSINVFGI